jgi:carboxypeptidase C (cathepsin A)
MTQNPDLEVFVANGYYDLATPFFATEYTFSHLGLDPSLEGHVTLRYYEAGHMMYIHKPSLEKLRGDLVEFLGRAIPPVAAETR